MQAPAIVLRDVTRRFGANTAVDALSLTVAQGEVFGFLGHNGAGKTTTVRLINGILQPDAGEIQVLGLNPQRDGPRLRAHTGVLTETPSLDERLTALDNLSIYADLYGVPMPQTRQRIHAVLALFGLADRASEKVGGYSKGMKQRLALARAFLHEPQLIFLDEPTAGLDPVAIQEVHQLIRHVSRDEGRTVFLCTHNLVEAQRLCDRVAIMDHGRLIAVGPPQELAQMLGADLRYTIEVDPAQLQQASAISTQLDDVRHCQAAGAELTLTVSSREVIPTLLAALLAEHIRVFAVTPQETALEEIYLALHQRRNG